MQALELVILSRHLNLHEELLSLWWPFIEFVLSLRWPYTRVCSVTAVTLHKSLFCHFHDLTQEFVLSLRWPYTRVVLSSLVRWIAGPVIGPDLQGQLPVQTYRASYRSRPTGPVIGPDLQGQLSVQTYRASYRYRPTGPVIGPDLQGQFSVQIYRASYRSRPTGPVVLGGRFCMYVVGHLGFIKIKK